MTELKRRKLRVLSRLAVHIESGPDAGKSQVFEQGAITAGTASDCQLLLSDPTVSRYHLELHARPEGVELIDLESSNGSYVSGVRVHRAVVAPNTRIQLGNTLLWIRDEGERVEAEDGPVNAIPGLVGSSDAIVDISSKLRRLARVSSSVLIEGETGVGKEVVAEALHSIGDRRHGPFVVVDCGSLPPTLIASQLFGHERGSFTGADHQRVGAFERARGGTVLLDEIGELPLEIQPSLLGVLERRRFVRVGGSTEVETDVRILAATNRDLRLEVNRNNFRSDLYYRLAVARLVIPPLRERREDIKALVAHFVEKIDGVASWQPLAAMLPALEAHPFNGNVRELRNIVEAALIMGDTNLPAGEARAAQPGHQAIEPYKQARADALDGFEKSYLSTLIGACEGNASEAARRARMDRPYLLTLLRKHGLR